MALTVTSVTDLSYADQQCTTVYMTVKFTEHPNPLPFLASPQDVEPHGRDLCMRAQRGDFGPIGPWVRPPNPPGQPGMIRRVLRAIVG